MTQTAAHSDDVTAAVVDDCIAGDRRSDRRYPIELQVHWKLARGRKIFAAGTGRTINLSSGGILFDPGQPLPPRGNINNIELSISWPVLLHHTTPMQLVVVGRIVRSAQSEVAIRMEHYDFRTRKTLNSGQMLQ